MPFTVSHAAAVLPLTYLPKRWFSLTGLFIGSMAPDFEYFLTMNTSSHYSHTIAGIFWFDLPVGILLAFIFHNVVRNSLFDNLPLFFKSRFWAFRQFDWNKHFKQYWLAVSISIVIGAAIHLFWDDITDHHGLLERNIELLAGRIAISGINIPVIVLFEHLNTLLGGLLIMYAIYKLPADNTVKETTDVRYWIMLFIVTLLIVGVRFSDGLHLWQYEQFIVTCISAGMIALTVTPKFLALSKSRIWR